MKTVNIVMSEFSLTSSKFWDIWRYWVCSCNSKGRYVFLLV